MMSKALTRYAGVSMLILAILLAGCARTEPVKEEAPLVRTQKMQLNGNGQSSGYPGEVRGRYETQLAFQVSGKISKRNVELGSVVNAGDVLMEIDAKDIQQTVNITSAQMASAESQLNLAQSNLERYRKLFEQGAVSRAQLDQYENAYEVAAAAVRQTAAQYTQGANQLGYSALVADSTGVIAAVNAEAGQVVSAGQVVLTLVKDGEREIEISIPENRIEDLHNAQQIRVTFWALPDVIVEGKVREISPVADKITRTYKARISLQNPPAGVNLGMTANVAIASAGSRQAVYIPLAAIYQTGDTPGVWVVANETVSLRPVKVGAFGDGQIQVLEGLQDGDVIVTAGVQKLREGQKVRL
ncbi:efflux RND transporter periplasmic adaptor subunit [Anaerospora sp.]|uniref:efflux RND transporter periplasmic adaptor subunit n=1 Tax=Anaerospora sp. TaxID=1960278 RepID=UPI0037BEFA08